MRLLDAEAEVEELGGMRAEWARIRLGVDGMKSESRIFFFGESFLPDESKTKPDLSRNRRAP